MGRSLNLESKIAGISRQVLQPAQNQIRRALKDQEKEFVACQSAAAAIGQQSASLKLVQFLGLPGWRFLAKLNCHSPLNEFLLGKDEPAQKKALHSSAR